MREIQQDNVTVTCVPDAVKKAADRKRLAENLRRSIEAHKNRLAMARKSKQEQPRSATGSRTTLKNRYAHDTGASGHHSTFAQIHGPVSIKHTQSSLNKINAAVNRPYYNPNCKLHGIQNHGITSLNEPSPINIQLVAPNIPGNRTRLDNNTVQYCSAKLSVSSPVSDAVIGNTTISNHKHEVLNNTELCKRSNDSKDLSSDDLRKLIIESGISEAKVLELLRKIVMEILTGAHPATHTSIENDPDIKNLLSHRSGDNHAHESNGKQDKLMNLLLNCISTSIAASTKDDVLSSARSNKSVNVEINLNMPNSDAESVVESSRPVENNDPVMIESVFDKNSEGVVELEEPISLLDRLKTWTPNFGFLKCKTGVCGDCTKTLVGINSIGTKDSGDSGLVAQGTNDNLPGHENGSRAPSINNDTLKPQGSCASTPHFSKSIFRPRYQTRTSITQSDNTCVRADSRNTSIHGTGNVNYPTCNTVLHNGGSKTTAFAVEQTPSSGAKYVTKAKTYARVPTVAGNNNGYFTSPKIALAHTSNIAHEANPYYSSFNDNSHFVQPKFVPAKMGTAPLNTKVAQRTSTGNISGWSPKTNFVPVTRMFHVPRVIHPLNANIPGHVQNVYGTKVTPINQNCAIHGSPIVMSNNWNPNSPLMSSKRVVDTLNTLGRLSHI